MFVWLLYGTNYYVPPVSYSNGYIVIEILNGSTKLSASTSLYGTAGAGGNMTFCTSCAVTLTSTTTINLTGRCAAGTSFSNTTQSIFQAVRIA